MDGTDLVPLLAVVMAVGAVGTIVPLLPGLALIWVAGLIYGLAEGFGSVGVAAFGVMTALAAGAALAGWVVPHRRASAAGASRASVWLGVLAAIVGFFVVPVVGLPLGGVLGIYVGENLRTRDPAAALGHHPGDDHRLRHRRTRPTGRGLGDDRRVDRLGAAGFMIRAGAEAGSATGSCRPPGSAAGRAG